MCQGLDTLHAFATLDPYDLYMQREAETEVVATGSQAPGEASLPKRDDLHLYWSRVVYVGHVVPTNQRSLVLIS